MHVRAASDPLPLCADDSRAAKRARTSRGGQGEEEEEEDMERARQNETLDEAIDFGALAAAAHHTCSPCLPCPWPLSWLA